MTTEAPTTEAPAAVPTQRSTADLLAEINADLSVEHNEEELPSEETEEAPTEEVQEEEVKEEKPEEPAPRNIATKYAQLQQKHQHLEADLLKYKAKAEQSEALEARLAEIAKDPFKALKAAGTSWQKFLKDLHEDKLAPPTEDDAFSKLPKEVQEMLNEHKETKARLEQEAKQKEQAQAFEQDKAEVAYVLKERAEDFPFLNSLPNAAEILVNHFYALRQSKPDMDASEQIRWLFNTVEERTAAQAKQILKNASARKRLYSDEELAGIISEAVGNNTVKQSNPLATEKQTTPGAKASKPTTLTNSVGSKVPARVPNHRLSDAEMVAQLNKDLRGE